MNGYVYNLTTNREETGYIQLFYDSGVYSLVGFTYEGRHFIEKMLDAYNLKTTLRYNTTEKKLVYAGGMDYLIFDSKSSSYYNLNNQTFVENDKLSEIKTNYQRISTEILACESYIQSNGVSRDTGVKRYVLNANNLDIVITDDFYGEMLNGVPVDNHCSPTAGTTIIKYWANRRGVSRLYHQSDWWVFSSLFVNMGTSSSSGTYESDVLSGTISYSENTRGVSISGSDFWGNSLLENRTFAKAQAYINADVPFYLNVPGHTMACFGYYTVGGRQQVIVANGWDRIWTFTSFPALNSISFQYVRWN